MMRQVYRREVAPLAFAPPAVYLMALGGVALMVAGVCTLARCELSAAAVPLAGAVARIAGRVAAAAVCVSFAALIAAVAIHCRASDCAKIQHKVRRAMS